MLRHDAVRAFRAQNASLVSGLMFPVFASEELHPTAYRALWGTGEILTVKKGQEDLDIEEYMRNVQQGGG